MDVVRVIVGIGLLAWSMRIGAQGCARYGTAGTDIAYQVIATSDGGMLIVGEEDGDASVVKFAADGTLQWSRRIGGDKTDVFTDVVEVPGAYVAVGYTKSFGAGGYDVYVVAWRKDGTLAWTKTFGGGDDDYAYAVVITADSLLKITGTTKSAGNGGWDIYLLELDTIGAKSWEGAIGGANEEMGIDLVALPDSGIVIVGSTTSFGALGVDIYVIRLDRNNNIVWTRIVGGSNDDDASAAQLVQDSVLIMTGKTYSYGPGTPSYTSIWFARMDLNGNLQWFKTIGGNMWDFPHSLTRLSDNTLVLIGLTASYGSGGDDVYLARFNVVGDTLWTRTLGGAAYDEGFGIAQTGNGSLWAVGYTWSHNANNEDFLVAKLDLTSGSSCLSCNTGRGGIVMTHTPASTTGGTITPLTFSTASGGTVSSGGTLDLICGTLPLQAIYLKVQRRGSEVTLTWTDVADSPGPYTVLRNDGTGWHVLATTAEKSFVDVAGAAGGVLCYQVLRNQAHSNIACVQEEESKAVNWWWNGPYLVIESPFNGTVHVEVSNLIGQRMPVEYRTHGERIWIDAHELPSGLYSLTLHEEKASRVQKLTIWKP